MNGCFQCPRRRCGLHPYLELGNKITSSATGKIFQIRGHYDCESPSVIYVVTCKRCNVQYVGESGNPCSRLKKYQSAIWRPLPPNATAIERHVADGRHVPSDLSLKFVGGLPRFAFDRECLVNAIRLRLENIWIHRLKTALNKRRRLASSFLGPPLYKRQRTHL